MVAGAIALFTFGPAYFRHTLSAIFVISTDAEAAAPYKIDVKPGDATVAKGADQLISATLSGFDAAEAAILVKKASTDSYERVPMVKAENGSYEGMLFDLAEPLDYVIEAAGVKSASHKLNVVDPPADYPDYGEGYYAVFFTDPDGLKLEGMVFKPPRRKRVKKKP